MYDIPALLASLPQRTQFLAKKSLFRIPFFGWGLRLGAFVPVDREDRRRARESFTAAADRLAAGDSVLVFPEETRSPDGALLPFKKGGFLLALKSGLPIVPVGIRGTFAVRRRGSLKISPSRIEVRYGGPIEVASYGVKQREDLMAEVRRRIAELADTG
jgi:1-acyl-sn-glycerol-3-phosphate acyltransferase